PFSKGGSLSVQQAWDVAYYMNSHERPQDPRYDGSVQDTDKQFHAHQCRYGDSLHNHVLGKK
ncbi:MAG TPA: cytochrome C, partial [Pseudomonadales bacterium]